MPEKRNFERLDPHLVFNVKLRLKSQIVRKDV